MTDKIKIRRALISVSEKEGLRNLADALHRHGCEIISTGGTGAALGTWGIPYADISSVTGNPEAFGGRMKTISFQIESALLFDREKDSAEAESLGIVPIDLVVCNLYPFENFLARGAAFDELIEQIDIGGPTMIRAGAKNFRFVSVLTDPSDYDTVTGELDITDGCISLATRKTLMAKAFNLTADYDACIAQAMDNENGILSRRFAFTHRAKLRYGENSHQQAHFLRERNTGHSLADIRAMHGIELSYNNILDVSSAIETALALESAGCAIVKHNNPCGLAEGPTQRGSFELAWEGDPISAFGGIVAFNTPVERETLDILCYDSEDRSKRKFIEVIAAPAFCDEAMRYLSNQKNLRIIVYDKDIFSPRQDFRILHGSLLEQNPDTILYKSLELATENPFDLEQISELIIFGLKAVRQIKSNAIVIVRKRNDGYLQLVGMGSGQPNRLHATDLALGKAKTNLRVSSLDEIPGLALISDAFFPFEDNIELAHAHGIRTVAQPGGSIRDKHVIAKCNELNMNLIMTGTRHFKH